MDEFDNEVVITLEFPQGKYRGQTEWQNKAQLVIDVARAIMYTERGFITVVSQHVDSED
jgi:hypothetical protein